MDGSQASVSPKYGLYPSGTEPVDQKVGFPLALVAVLFLFADFLIRLASFYNTSPIYSYIVSVRSPLLVFSTFTQIILFTYLLLPFFFLLLSFLVIWFVPSKIRILLLGVAVSLSGLGLLAIVFDLFGLEVKVVIYILAVGVMSFTFSIAMYELLGVSKYRELYVVAVAFLIRGPRLFFVLSLVIAPSLSSPLIPFVPFLFDLTVQFFVFVLAFVLFVLAFVALWKSTPSSPVGKQRIPRNYPLLGLILIGSYLVPSVSVLYPTLGDISFLFSATYGYWSSVLIVLGILFGGAFLWVPRKYWYFIISLFFIVPPLVPGSLYLLIFLAWFASSFLAVFYVSLLTEGTRGEFVLFASANALVIALYPPLGAVDSRIASHNFPFQDMLFFAGLSLVLGVVSILLRRTPLLQRDLDIMGG